MHAIPTFIASARTRTLHQTCERTLDCCRLKLIVLDFERSLLLVEDVKSARALLPASKSCGPAVRVSRGGGLPLRSMVSPAPGWFPRRRPRNRVAVVMIIVHALRCWGHADGGAGSTGDM